MAKRSNKGLKLAGTVLGIMPTRQGQECLVVMQAFHAYGNEPIVTMIRTLAEVPTRYQGKVKRWMRELDLTPVVA